MKEQVEAVQRMQDYIQEHLRETVTLADLSRVSLFSPWHSYRLFRQWTNQTPADYIRRLRLSESALKLRDQRCRIADVAFEYGIFSGNLAAIPANMPGIRFLCICLPRMASNTESSERNGTRWKM